MKDLFINDSNISHLSFDFWDTLAFSNPEFKSERTKLISKYCSQSHNDIEKCIQNVGKNYNSLQESSNVFISPIDLLQQAINEITKKPDIYLETLFEEICTLFKRHKPILNRDCEELIEKCIIYKKKISILSNTAFIPGSLIKDFLISEFGVNTFIFYLFSDETQIAKPNFKVFDLAYKQINLTHNKTISKTSIIHIGDNYINDFEAAKKFGFQSHLILKHGVEI